MKNEDIIIDGRMGEGGGQVLRSSLSLAAALGRSVVIENVRGGRRKPGLLRQHRTALRGVRDITGGEIEGDELGATSVRFAPGECVHGGKYHFGIGSAGSTMLVLQTIVPPLLLAKAPSTILLEGGTHNPMAPTFECFADSFAPCLRAMGAEVTAELIRPGFFPAGGGQVRVDIRPVTAPRALELNERGAKGRSSCTVMTQNLPEHVAEREWKAFQKKVHWTRDRLVIQSVNGSRGPGNVMLARLESDALTTVFASFGAKNLSSELVGRQLGGLVRDYERTSAPVDVHLCDQLMLPMALLGGGSFRAAHISKHASTNAEVIGRFLEGAVEIGEGTREDGTTVTIRGAGLSA